MRDNIKAIKELANIRIEDILCALGVDYRERYYYLNGPCPVHGGNRRDAWSWHLDRGIWKCFSHSCDDEFGADIYGLVKGILKCDFKESIAFIKKTIDCKITPEEIKKLKDSRSNKDFIISSRKKKSREVIYPESCLEKLEQHDYLKKRGFSKDILDKYHVRACLTPNKYMTDRIIFPIRNKNGEIIGFSGRTIHEDWQKLGIPKWKHSRDYDAANNLFNVDCAINHIKHSGCAIIVEGPLDVLRLEEAGIHNSVAILGKTLHSGQMTLLMSLSAFKLSIALDNDGPGKQGAIKAAKSARVLFDVEIIKLPEDKNDIGDLSIEETKGVFK